MGFNRIAVMISIKLLVSNLRKVYEIKIIQLQKDYY